jgi:polyisoprenoid-binding protein YceI
VGDLVGKSKSFGGSGYSATYSGTVTLQTATVTLDADDPTQASVRIGYGLACSATVLDGVCGASSATSAL